MDPTRSGHPPPGWLGERLGDGGSDRPGGPHKIAARTPGFVGADLANLVNEAALLAARKNKEAVASEEFDEAIDRVTAGLEKKKRVMNAKEREIVAYHESGHAIVAECVQNTDPVHKITIIPRGSRPSDIPSSSLRRTGT